MGAFEIILIAAVLFFLILAIVESIRGIKEGKRENKLLLSQLDEDTPDDMHAEAASVVSRRTAGAYPHEQGHRRYKMELYVTFMKFDGSVVEYSVSEEIYKKCIPGTSGMLVTINGLFFDFGKGEDIE